MRVGSKCHHIIEKGCGDIHILIAVSDTHMWQSSVEIEDYSITYFDRIAVFEALYWFLGFLLTLIRNCIIC